ncbi:hypothetical protein LINPERHAP1_LOCUS23 [Linum perenne]
MLDMNMR